MVKYLSFWREDFRWTLRIYLRIMARPYWIFHGWRVLSNTGSRNSMHITRKAWRRQRNTLMRPTRNGGRTAFVIIRPSDKKWRKRDLFPVIRCPRPFRKNGSLIFKETESARELRPQTVRTCAGHYHFGHLRFHCYHKLTSKQSTRGIRGMPGIYGNRSSSHGHKFSTWCGPSATVYLFMWRS